MPEADLGGVAGEQVEADRTDGVSAAEGEGEQGRAGEVGLRAVVGEHQQEQPELAPGAAEERGVLGVVEGEVAMRGAAGGAAPHDSCEVGEGGGHQTLLTSLVPNSP